MSRQGAISSNITVSPAYRQLLTVPPSASPLLSATASPRVPVAPTSSPPSDTLDRSRAAPGACTNVPPGAPWGGWSATLAVSGVFFAAAIVAGLVALVGPLFVSLSGPFLLAAFAIAGNAGVLALVASGVAAVQYACIARAGQ